MFLSCEVSSEHVGQTFSQTVVIENSKYDDQHELTDKYNVFILRTIVALKEPLVIYERLSVAVAEICHGIEEKHLADNIVFDMV